MQTPASPAEFPALTLDAAAESNRLSRLLHEDVLRRLRRRGVVVGCSGGVDSSVVLALCVRAFGPEKVLAVLLPESESSPESAVLAGDWAQALHVETVTEDITGALEHAGCYRRRDEAIRRVFREFGSGWKSKITLPGSLLDEDTLNVFYLTVVSPEGEERRQRIPSAEYAQIVAASNFKQRTRMAMLYYHAERRGYAVVGTANKDEHDLGFFVKHGDGGVDIAPILHLFKTQVYRLAEHLGVPEDIRSRRPTSDTYSAGSTQEEFFYRLPFDVLDVIWAGMEHGMSPAEVAPWLGLGADQVDRVMRDIVQKRRTTDYLRTPPIVYDGQTRRRETSNSTSDGEDRSR
ncbi:MAG TPA: NAD(+) synthase [Anaerolineales bacterium]|nr:NAD(+) synthase [Anaerolineales bacterium]